MEDEVLDEELSMMYEEPGKAKVLDSSTFLRPLKQLKLRKPVLIDVSQTVKEALTLMQVKQVGCVLVTRGVSLAGIITERDLVSKGLARGVGLGAVKVQEFMTPDPVTLQPEDSVAFVLNAMHVGGYRHVPIVDERNRPLAVVSVKDIIGFIVENFPEEILNLPPKPIRKTEQLDGG
ncbi:MAG TPA: CBS domain-containing protein [Bacteroidota bacterium]|jgi:CBS domain-containing protein